MKTIALDVGGTKIKAGVVEGDNVSQVLNKKTRNNGSLEEILAQISEIIERLLSDDIKAIALGLPSKVDPGNGEVISTTNIPELKEFNIVGYLKELFHLPIAIHNDTACFALGEYHYGSGKDKHSLVGVTLGTGMGIAAISGGMVAELYKKEDIEFGERKFLDKTFEDYCSGKYFLDNFRKDSLQMQKLAEEGDSKALESFKNLGKHLAEAIEILISEHDPEIVVLGGSIAKSYFLFKEELKDVEAKVVLSELENSALLGAASLIDKK